jgi:hypothetical protein
VSPFGLSPDRKAGHCPVRPRYRSGADAMAKQVAAGVRLVTPYSSSNAPDPIVIHLSSSAVDGCECSRNSVGMAQMPEGEHVSYQDFSLAHVVLHESIQAARRIRPRKSLCENARARRTVGHALLAD